MNKGRSFESILPEILANAANADDDEEDEDDDDE